MHQLRISWWGIPVILSALLASAGVRPARAQFAPSSDQQEQTVARQLAIADVGDTVRVTLLNRRDRPEGVIKRQNAESIQLSTESGRKQTFHRRFVYAVTLIKDGTFGEPQPEEAPAEEEEEPALPPLDVPLGMDNPRTQKIEGEVPDASRARLLFAPTARTQKPGQVYLASHEIFFPYAAVGIGNVVDVRAGVSVTPNTVQFMYGGLKFGLIQQDRFHLAVGGFGATTTNVITVEEGANDEYGGAVYALSTIGTPEKALTVGAGYIASGGFIREKSFAMVGGELRLGDSNVKLLTENYLLYGSGEEVKSKKLFGGQFLGGDINGALSLSARIIRPRASVDLGLATFNQLWDATIPVIPFITFSYHLTSIEAFY